MCIQRSRSIATITDFSRAQADKIDVQGLYSGTLAWGGTSATANGVWFVDNGNNTSTFYVDTNGSTGSAEFSFTVNNTPVTGADFVASDFLL